MALRISYSLVEKSNNLRNLILRPAKMTIRFDCSRGVPLETEQARDHSRLYDLFLIESFYWCETIEI